MQISYLSVGLLALSANAFLIPGDAKDFYADTTLERQELEQQKQQLNLDCSSCPFALDRERDGLREWTDGVASDLELNVASDGKNLRFNGIPFYPMQAPGLPPTLYVFQNSKGGKETTIKGFQGKLRLSYSLEYDVKKTNDGSSLITVQMTVFGLENKMIRVHDVEVKAIKEASDNLILHSVSAIPVSPDSQDAKCGNLVCRVFAKTVAAIRKAKASAKTTGHHLKGFCVKCFQGLAGHAKPTKPPAHRLADGTLRLPTHHRFRPSLVGGKPHQHAHHHGFVHRMASVIWATARMALVPVLIGIAFGMAASAIGMLVGQLVVFFWIRYRGDEQMRYEVVATDEKDGLPSYEDVPAADSRIAKDIEAKA